MTFFDFAYRNIVRDFKTYLYYFINCVFSVFIFFLFAVLSFHPTLRIIDKNSTMGLVLVAAEIVSIGFSIAFISYSVSHFLQGRNKQFGLITILGGSKKQLNKLIFLENMIIGSFSIIVGIVIGIVFSKLFLTVAGKAIGGLQLGFYIPIRAIILTVFILGSVFYLISIVTPKLVRKEKIIKLLKTEEVGGQPPKMIFFYVLFVVSTMFLILTVVNKNMVDKLNTLLLPIGLVCIVTGSYILFFLTIHLYLKVQIKTRKYYEYTKLLSMTNMKNSMKVNLQSLTISTVLYAIAFLSIIIIISSAGNVENETRKIVPYAYMYASWSEDANTEEHVKWIEKEISGLPGYKQAKFIFYKYPELESRQTVISATQYNEMSKFLGYDSVHLEDGEVYVIGGNVKEKLYDIPNLYREKLEQQGISIKFVGYSEKLLAVSGYLRSVTVVSDDVFSRISGELESFDIYAFDVSNWTQVKMETDKLVKNLILYIGSILCFAFLLAVASFTYSRLYSTMEKECEKYKGIIKIGLSRQELYKILSSSVRLIVILPFVVALVYMWIGVFVIDKYSIISNTPTAMICTAIYTVMQVIVYIWIKNMYQKGITKGVYDER